MQGIADVVMTSLAWLQTEFKISASAPILLG